MNEKKENSLKNLISFDQMSPEKHKEASKNGGIKSGEAKREKKMLREYLEMILSMEDADKEDRYTKITRALIDKAEDGDTKAFEVIRDTLGQKPVDKLNMSANLSYEEKIKEVADSDEY